jgi:hypothetical protein
MGKPGEGKNYYYYYYYYEWRENRSQKNQFAQDACTISD